jgi:hypothetical protein
MEMFWIFLAVVVVARSPIGRALADKIAGRVAPGTDPAELEAVEQRLEARLIDLEERMDFAERVLQRQRGREGLPPIE